MEQELEQNDIKLKEEIRTIKDKYATIKKEIRNKYKSEKPKNSRVSIPKAVKDTIWDQCFGKEAGIGKCYCCSGEINSKKFDCGHIISVANSGTNNIDNLKPICSTCNKSMGTTNMEEFKKEYFAKIENCKVCRDTVVNCETKYKDINEKIRGHKSVGMCNDMGLHILCKGNIDRNKESTNKCSDCRYSTADCDQKNKFKSSGFMEQRCWGYEKRKLNVF